MKLPLGSPPAPRRASLLARVLQRGDSTEHRTPTDSWDPSPHTAPGPVSAACARDEAGPSSTETGLYRAAREHIKRHSWARAQHALEQIASDDPECPAALDLQSVRRVRRALRRVARRPSDVDGHLDLGRACFDLDLGDAALGEFTRAQQLAPDRYEGFALAALEYLYRGEYTRALGAWIRGREVNADLPELDDLLGSLRTK